MVSAKTLTLTGCEVKLQIQGCQLLIFTRSEILLVTDKYGDLGVSPSGGQGGRAPCGVRGAAPQALLYNSVFECLEATSEHLRVANKCSNAASRKEHESFFTIISNASSFMQF